MPAPSGQIVLKPGALTTTAVTADQVILTHTISPGKTFVLEYLQGNVGLTTYAATATDFGTMSLECPAGKKIQTWRCVGAGALNSPIFLDLPEPLPISDGDGSRVIRLVCTPAAATSMKWEANIGGYER